MEKVKWEKKGLVFASDGRYEWMQSYAQKTAVLIMEDRLRVYFACRTKRENDGNYTSLTTFVDCDKSNPSKVIHVHDRPILFLGEPGTFDQFGVVPGCVLPVGEEIWYYYVGWMRYQGVPYNCAIGLAISDDRGVEFRRLDKGPLLGPTLKEPFLQCSAFVMQRGNVFHMWYSSGIEWIEYEGRMESVYVLMHAVSHDGIYWEREGIPCIPHRVEHECQAGPSVIEIGKRFHMWFCYRYGVDFRNASHGYRIGYAWSDDLKNWHRDDDMGALMPSREGWDSQMVCYPHVVNVDGNIYMFYSGNYFGRDGFGYAVLLDGDQKW